MLTCLSQYIFQHKEGQKTAIILHNKETLCAFAPVNKMIFGIFMSRLYPTTSSIYFTSTTESKFKPNRTLVDNRKPLKYSESRLKVFAFLFASLSL